MKLCRFQPLEFFTNEVGRSSHAIHPQPRGGVIEGDTVWEIAGELWGSRERIGSSQPLESVKLLPPAVPSKIVCVGKNYVDHAAEMGGPPPKEPILFLKPPSSITAPEDPVILPSISHRVDYEGEIAVVIGRRCHRLHPDEDVHPYILGYTCFNDVTARDLQKLDGQWTRGKSFDTFCPFGPVLETNAPSTDARVETYVNGVRKQSARLAEMIFSVDVIIRFIAQVMTLEPGDLIATGTPAGIGPVVAGDVMEISVTGIGTLRNPVIDSADDTED
ncbi:MAG TPA: fumarylacetoacetate hydrolase family protein [Candidatus Limnocylindria bacterium]|nr:fumarylacetoacetate hydrolase family protein [Candidatus Limnocylindria bacterium]